MNLVCDLLDQSVVDRNGHPMGRVDGIVLELRKDAPPRVAAIAIGPTVLAERLSPGIGRRVAAVLARLGLARAGSLEINMRDVEVDEDHVRVGVAVGQTAAGTVERVVRGWIGRLPGAG